MILKHLIDTTKYLKDMGLETFLTGSTLLQIVRDNDLKERHKFDREINIGCLFEDYTPQVEKRIRLDFGMVMDQKGWVMFGNQQGTFWEGGCYTMMGKFKKVEDKRIEYMGDGNELIFPSYFLDGVKQITFKKHKFNVPNYHERWLGRYFGKGWRKEDLNWHWTKSDLLIKEKQDGS